LEIFAERLVSTNVDDSRLVNGALQQNEFYAAVQQNKGDKMPRTDADTCSDAVLDVLELRGVNPTLAKLLR
jgi:hypothetical protein